MDPANWLTAIGQFGHLFADWLPDALWLAYAWAKAWQVFLAGAFVLIAAQIFAQASVRSARIRAAASVRAAQIAAGISSGPHEKRDSPSSPSIEILPAEAWPQRREDHDLVHKLEQLRSLIRSAMAMLGSDIEGTVVAGSIYCERIARLHFEEKDLPIAVTANTLELYKHLLLQLAAVRRANEKGVAQSVLSEALFQLNTRARELAAAVAPRLSGLPNELTRRPGQVRG